ncbi:Long-chain-fatty-acid--CoA ligase [Nymphon striatum]|nr:Long-chain-fatty-acid--CoA ligase [Nymphon striatum]
MYPCSNFELVAAVSKAGGLGVVQPVSLTFVHKQDFRQALRDIKAVTDNPIGMNALIEKSSKRYHDKMVAWVDIALEEGVRFFITSLGNPKWVVDTVSQVGGVVYHDVTERKWAQKGIDGGAQGLIAVNNHAGGHAGAKSKEQLFEELYDFDVPLVCAGGIGDEAQYAEAIQMGYAACQLGTRFIATKECTSSVPYKEAIIDAKEEDIVLSERITGVPVSIINTEYVKSQGVKAGKLASWLLNHPKGKHWMRLFYTIRSVFKLRKSSMDEAGKQEYWQAGKSVAGVHEIEPAGDIVKRKFRERPAYSNLGKSLSYGDIDEMTRDFAAYLTNDVGLKKGDRIAIMMPNLMQYPIVLFAALRAGLIVVNTNPLYTDRELEHQMKDSGAVAIVILENFAHTLEEVLKETEIKTVITTRIGDMADFPKSILINFVVKYIKKMVPSFHLPNAIKFKDALAKGKGKPFSDVDVEHEDVAFLQYTGGTTGVAKGAALTHKNMIANLLQASAWASKDLVEGEEIFITPLPLYHIFSLTANALFAMKIGAKNVLITNPRDMPGFVKELSKEKFSFITGVNTLFNGLLHAPGFDQLDFSHLKLVLGGGMAVQESVATEWKRVTGHTLIEAYGLTETSPAVSINPINLADYNGTIGLPVSSTIVCLKDESGEEITAFNEAGELCIKGPQVMQGYWNRPLETENVMDKDGWLHTGDVAEINEDGYIKLVDRLKDLIIVSGFNVYPNEIENVVASHPKVLEVGAIGVPHEKSGEAVKIFVVKDDESLTEKELQDYCHEEMTGYKCPKFITFVDDLPKSNVGKVLRKDLRDL